MAHERISNVEALLGIMDSKGIDKALVFSSFAKEVHPGANEELCSALLKTDRLLPCFTTMPHYTGECQSPLDMVESMRLGGSRAVRIFPVHHRVSLHLWLWEELLKVLCERRIPLLVDFSNPTWSADLDYDGLRTVCMNYPELPVILMRASVSADRYIYRLFDECPNLYLDTSYYQPHNGIYNIVTRFSARRLLFGSGLPVYEPDSPLFAVIRSGIGEKDKQDILSGNWERLWGEAEL